MEGCKEKVNTILNKTVVYNRETNMLGPVLTCLRFTEHADGKGYDALEVFADAAAAEKYYANF